MWRRRRPDAGPSKTAGAVAAAVTTGTEARLAWIRRRCRYRPLNPGVRMHERACVDGCRPSGSSGDGYQPEAARLTGIAPNEAAWSAPAVLGRWRNRRDQDAGVGGA